MYNPFLPPSITSNTINIATFICVVFCYYRKWK